MPPATTLPEITAVYLPLVSVLIPEWLRVLKRKEAKSGAPPPRKVRGTGTELCRFRSHDAGPARPGGHTRRRAVHVLSRCSQVLILVSGAGQPRDTDANPQDNSTEGTARIIQRFVEVIA